MTTERRQPTFLQMINTILPALVLALLSWIALQIVDVKVDIPIIKKDVAAIRADLLLHDENGQEAHKRARDLHHTRNMTVPCNGCHHD